MCRPRINNLVCFAFGQKAFLLLTLLKMNMLLHETFVFYDLSFFQATLCGACPGLGAGLIVTSCTAQ